MPQVSILCIYDPIFQACLLWRIYYSIFYCKHCQNRTFTTKKFLLLSKERSMCDKSAIFVMHTVKYQIIDASKRIESKNQAICITKISLLSHILDSRFKWMLKLITLLSSIEYSGRSRSFGRESAILTMFTMNYRMIDARKRTGLKNRAICIEWRPGAPVQK